MARIKRGSQSYHTPSVAEQRAAKDYKPGGGRMGLSGAADRAKQAQIEKETKAHNERKAKEKKKSQRAKHRARVVAARSSNPTPGEKQKPRVGSDARTKVGGGAPGSFVAGGLARAARGR